MIDSPSEPELPRRATPCGAASTYGGYLRLDRLLTAQVGRSTQHDELLFIIQHQTSELWMKLMIHELGAAIAHLQQDRLGRCARTLERVKQVQRQLFDQWSVLETMSLAEYLTFRDALGGASGIQSHQYRAIEYLLGNKSDPSSEAHRSDAAVHAELGRLLAAPSLYDELLRALARAGHPVPSARLARDFSLMPELSPEIVAVFRRIYERPDAQWAAYVLCELLVDLEELFQLWRFRHVKVVERVIGARGGTGGTSGAVFLRKRLELTFFPELLRVRTEF
jgi:tryptophan 2,3-dioxygenase